MPQVPQVTEVGNNQAVLGVVASNHHTPLLGAVTGEVVQDQPETPAMRREHNSNLFTILTILLLATGTLTVIVGGLLRMAQSLSSAHHDTADRLGDAALVFQIAAGAQWVFAGIFGATSYINSRRALPAPTEGTPPAREPEQTAGAETNPYATTPRGYQQV